MSKPLFPAGDYNRSLSTSPSGTTLAASDPGVDHPQFPSFSVENGGSSCEPEKRKKVTPITDAAVPPLYP
jgi:hypothetical protein